MYEVRDWNDIKDEFSGFLILGNGASISISNSFRYNSLLEEACKEGFISSTSQTLFESFKTYDFESILRMLWYAQRVNESLGIKEDKTFHSYNEIRDALIRIVRKIHPPHESVSYCFDNASSFLKGFDVVFSLNYDLLLYWIMLYSNDFDRTHAFKDCFDKQEFSDTWRKYREPIYGQKKSTLVFYPHGNLILAKRDEVESKVVTRTDGGSLLEVILDKWINDDYIPQFISEGTSIHKLNSINRSHYLSTVYYDALPCVHRTLTIYGWSFSENDDHILSILKNKHFPIEKVAVSVYEEGESAKRYCEHVMKKIHDISGRYDIDIVFYKSNSLGCWIN